MIKLTIPSHFITSSLGANDGGVLVTNQSSSDNALIDSVGKWNSASSSLEFYILANITTTTSITITANESLGFQLSALGVHRHDEFVISGIRPTLGYRDFTSGQITLFTGAIDTVERVGYFAASSLAITTLIPNTVTAMTIDWRLSGNIEIGEEVSVVLSGYRRTDGDSGYSTTAVSDVTIATTSMGSTYVTGSWNPNTTTLSFLAYRTIANVTTMTITIDSDQGFINPAKGVCDTSAAFTISSNAVDAPVYKQIISTFSVVPSILDSTISFVSSDMTKRIVDTYNQNSIQLLPGHPFIDLDNGTIVSIQNTSYTVTSVVGDFLYVPKCLSFSVLLLL
jgi:hypothetical protein